MSTEDTPKPAAWTFGASYWTRAESIPLAIIAQAEPLFDQATIAAAVAKKRERCAAIAESWATEETATTCANIAAAIRGA